MKWRRTTFIDEVHEGDEAVVLIESRAVKIGGLGPHVLAILGENSWEFSDLCAELQQALGTPESGSVADFVQDALDQLAGERLIESH